VREIKLTQGYTAKVSDKDYARVNALKWHAVVMYRNDGSIKAVYAVHTAPVISGKQKQFFMHRFIRATDSRFIDHKDHDGLNNQRGNLRNANRAQNFHNARTSVKNTSGFKGVSPVKGKISKPWRADIAFGGKQYFLGYFVTAKEAAQVHDKAARKYHKSFATIKKEN
jgi:hypothetical protein